MMKAIVFKYTWFFTCFFLFCYNAWRCVNQYLLAETVTKTSQERQELHNFPLICLGPDSLSKTRTAKLNITPEDYQKGGVWKTVVMSEEEVFKNLTLGFTSLVKKIKVNKTKKKNSDAYEKVHIKSEDWEKSGVTIVPSDYYYELRRHCVKFPTKVFPYGIQRIIFDMKQIVNAKFFVASPGNVFGPDRKSNEFSYSGGLSRLSIEYSQHYSLNLDREPCSEEASWKEDDCTLGIINDMIMGRLNCTTPWLINFARLIICSVGCVKNGIQRVLKNLLALFAAIWYIN